MGHNKICTNKGDGDKDIDDILSLWPIAVALFIGLILAAIGFMNYTPPNRDDNGTNKTVSIVTTEPTSAVHMRSVDPLDRRQPMYG